MATSDGLRPTSLESAMHPETSESISFPTAAASDATGGTYVPTEPLGRLFLRFLRFGCLAWGGPIAQIGMVRHSLVDEQKWVSSEHFNRVLALYQILPGPEAHELCVYFGMLSRGRIGGVLAGVGFMLPGFVLMFALSWLYVRFGLDTSGALGLVFASIQAAVGALIVRALHRIGRHALEDAWLWVIGIVGLLAQVAGVHFALILATGGLLYLLAQRQPAGAGAALAIAVVALIAWFVHNGSGLQGTVTAGDFPVGERTAPGAVPLFLSGLKAGLLTFGGAYTAIPLLQHEAVARGAWMTNAQFLDGLALSGLLPAPLIIFSTFVGYIGGGPAGALLMTAGTFLPAFAFTLVAHEPLERLVHHPRARTFLKGLMAAVVGLIAGTAVSLLLVSIVSAVTAAIFLLALGALFYWHSKLLVPLMIAAAAGIGWLASFL